MDGTQDSQNNGEPAWQFKPGETISPRSAAPVAAPIPPAEPVQAPQPNSAPPEAPAPVAPTLPEPAPVVEQPAPAPEPTPEPSPPQQAPVSSPASHGNVIRWTASEYVANEKTAGWHFAVGIVAVLAAILVWIITKDFVTAFVIILAGGVLSLYGGRKPNALQYQLDDDGLSIGQKHFKFSDFKAFSVAPEGAFASIYLVPVKRFAPTTTLYFAPEDADAILSIIGTHLPHQKHRTDAVDALMSRIHF